ncbi:hypothetical protein E6O75_ATG00536 [Venturia nashicola]|uniref:Uncharacterized protein n=1 Tax=Venturia nashicola TaxID=86259 RepID=A0A4Z1PNK7_9PEZI|nr:hypothetical protein E6O75_ATG00536 [Venturia nashicola]
MTLPTAISASEDGPGLESGMDDIFNRPWPLRSFEIPMIEWWVYGTVGIWNGRKDWCSFTGRVAIVSTHLKTSLKCKRLERVVDQHVSHLVISSTIILFLVTLDNDTRDTLDLPLSRDAALKTRPGTPTALIGVYRADPARFTTSLTQHVNAAPTSSTLGVEVYGATSDLSRIGWNKKANSFDCQGPSDPVGTLLPGHPPLHALSARRAASKTLTHHRDLVHITLYDKTQFEDDDTSGSGYEFVLELDLCIKLRDVNFERKTSSI